MCGGEGDEQEEEEAGKIITIFLILINILINHSSYTGKAFSILLHFRFRMKSNGVKLLHVRIQLRTLRWKRMIPDE